MKILFFAMTIGMVAAVVIWMREKRKNKISARPSESQKKDDDMTHILMPAGSDGDFRGLVYQNSGSITAYESGTAIALSNLNDGFNGTLELRAILIDFAEAEGGVGTAAALKIDINVKGGSGYGQSESLRVYGHFHSGEYEEVSVNVSAFIENKTLTLQTDNPDIVLGYRNITITAKD